MVYLHFPAEFTEEEKMLKKKYEHLRLLQNRLKIPKQEPLPPKPLKRSLEAKPDAKEVAKKLLKSGAISAIKVENKERQGFKRPKAAERKRNSGGRQSTSGFGFQPFSTSGKSDNGLSISSPSDSVSSACSNPHLPVKKLYESFVNSGKLEDEIKENCVRQRQRWEQERVWAERPRQGNTVFVRGYGVTQELLQQEFKSIGNIINISMEMDKKCGYVTFEKIEQAQAAIKTFNGTILNDVRLSVVLARKQPLLQSLGKDSLLQASLPVNFSQTGNLKDTRSHIISKHI